jgi:hypothetical protein
MEGIAYPNEEDLLMVVRLNVVLPEISGQLLRFPTGLVGITVRPTWRLVWYGNVFGNVHVKDARIVVDSPLNVALGIINLRKSTEM